MTRYLFTVGIGVWLGTAAFWPQTAQAGEETERKIEVQEDDDGIVVEEKVETHDDDDDAEVRVKEKIEEDDDGYEVDREIDRDDD